MNEVTEPIRVPLIIHDIRDKLIHKNRNWLCMIIGETGSGKSWSAIRLAELIDPNFPEDASRIYFSVKDMIDDMRTGKLKKGDCAILDETGVSFSSRKWWAVENRNFGFLLQAVRHRNFAIIFCLPSSSMMDKTGRVLMHTIIQTQHVSYMGQYVRALWKNSKWNDIEGKMYYRFPMIKNPDGKMIRVTEVRIHKPSNRKLLDNYEFKKTLFTQKLMDDAAENIKKSIDKTNQVKRPVGRPRKNPLPIADAVKV